MSWGDTLILVISRGVQLYYGIAKCKLLNLSISVKSGLLCMDDSNESQNEDQKVMSPPNFFSVNFGNLTLHS